MPRGMSIEPSDMSVTCSGSGWGDVRTNANDNATKMFENDEKKIGKHCTQIFTAAISLEIKRKKNRNAVIDISENK